MPDEKNSDDPQISVADFIKNAPAELAIEVLAGANGLRNKYIASPQTQRLGLALAKFSDYVHAERVQIIGQRETSYLLQLGKQKRIEALDNLDSKKINCIFISSNLAPSPELVEIAERKNLPLLRTALGSSKTISLVSGFLHKILAPQISMHGVLMEIYGLGVLILGESGIGKSECALDLITHGHRLISDDQIILKKIGESLIGSSPELTREHLEIRGLGLVNVRDLFGVSAIGKPQAVELVIEVKKWNETVEVERLGLDRDEKQIFDLKITKFVLPVRAGRNLSTLIETAVRIHLLRDSGFDAAKNLIEKHTRMLNEAGK
jgi:HPr kinase/phosphorylase